MKEVYHELIIRLLPLIKKSETYLFAIRNCRVLKESCLMMYRTLPPLESLTIEEKKDLWDYVCSNLKGTKEERVEVTKIVYVITHYL